MSNFILFQFFKWADEYQANKTGSKEVGQKSSSKLTVSSPDSLMTFLKSHVSWKSLGLFRAECNTVSCCCWPSLTPNGLKWLQNRNKDDDGEGKGDDEGDYDNDAADDFENPNSKNQIYNLEH